MAATFVIGRGADIMSVRRVASSGYSSIRFIASACEQVIQGCGSRLGKHDYLVQSGLLYSRQQPHRLVIAQILLHVPDFIHAVRCAVILA